MLYYCHSLKHPTMANFAVKSLFLLSALVAEDLISANANVNSADNTESLENADSAEGADPFDLAWNSYFEDFDMDDLMELYGCHGNNHVKTFDQTIDVPPYSMVPTEETWGLFEEAYYFAVGMEAPLKKQKDSSRGMKIPYEIRYDSGVGRGVFTTKFVPKGTIVWTADHTVAFQSIEEDGIEKYPTYRRFVEYLNDHRTEKYNWACDVFLWTFTGNNNYYADDCGINDDLTFCVALDHGSLFNDAMGEILDETVTAHFSKNLTFSKSLPFGVEGYPRGTLTEEFSTTKKMNLPISRCQRDVVMAARDIRPGEGTCPVFIW